jgi:hypothetical protein
VGRVALILLIFLNIVLSGLNVGILLFDVVAHSGRFPSPYPIAPTVVGLLFGAIGVATFGLHWSLGRIHRNSTSTGDPTAVAALAVPWKVLHLALGGLLAMGAALMAGASLAMIGRLGQGFTIFG